MSSLTGDTIKYLCWIRVRNVTLSVPKLFLMASFSITLPPFLWCCWCSFPPQLSVAPSCRMLVISVLGTFTCFKSVYLIRVCVTLNPSVVKFVEEVCFTAFIPHLWFYKPCSDSVSQPPLLQIGALIIFSLSFLPRATTQSLCLICLSRYMLYLSYICPGM